MAKLKALLPTLREKKRYVVFEVIAKNKAKDFAIVSKAVWQEMLGLHGTKGTAEAGLLILPEKYNSETQRGIARINHKWTDSLKASFALIQSIDSTPAIVRSVLVSGSLKKAASALAG
jgi:ribonuclease P/MRP protein subunit POP5